MEENNNIFSNILSMSELEDILAYIDFDLRDDSCFIKNIEKYIEFVINNNNILEKKFVVINNKKYIVNIKNFNIKDYYKIKYTNYKNFYKYINKINSKYNNKGKWFFYFCIDQKYKKGRIFFKIDHAYADGYKVIEMLTGKNYTNKLQTKKIGFINKVFYMFIGTLILIFSHIKFCFKCIYSYLYDKNNEETDNHNEYIIIPPLNFKKVKNICNKKNITINDFLYSFMLNSHSLYKNDFSHIITVSSINISKEKYTNNMLPLFLNVNNTNNFDNLLYNVHNTFNYCKKSMFINLFSSIFLLVPYIFNFNSLLRVYKLIINNIELTYSNMIGPTKKDIEENINNLLLGANVKDIHFLTVSGGITYNIISYENKINIIISYKKDKIKNKRYYKECIIKNINKFNLI